jgi:polar amino acid transport system permease protein
MIVMSSYSFDWGVIGTVLPHLLDGLWTTLGVAAVVIAISTVLGFPLALARMSKIEVIRWPAQIYIEVFRCTPMLVQLLWVFYALPAFMGVTFPALLSVVLALSGNLTAFMAEAYRAGLQSVPVEQVEAAEMLRLPRFSVLRHIVIPQAFRQQIPTILSLDVQIFKDTSLISALGVSEITFQGNVMSSQTFRPMEVFTLVAIMYFVVAFPATLITSTIERRMLDSAGPGAPPRGGLGFVTGLMPGRRTPPASISAQPVLNSGGQL